MNLAEECGHLLGLKVVIQRCEFLDAFFAAQPS